MSVVTPLTYRRHRAEALAAGPADAAIGVAFESEFQRLRSDDVEVADVFRSLDGDAADHLLAAVYRTGDVTELRRMIDAGLNERATAAAHERAERDLTTAWDDAGESLAEGRAA